MLVAHRRHGICGKTQQCARDGGCRMYAGVRTLRGAESGPPVARPSAISATVAGSGNASVGGVKRLSTMLPVASVELMQSSLCGYSNAFGHEDVGFSKTVRIGQHTSDHVAQTQVEQERVAPA